MIFCARFCQIKQLLDRGLCIVRDESHLEHIFGRVLNHRFTFKDMVELFGKGDRIGCNIIFVRKFLRDIRDDQIFLLFKHCLCLCNLQTCNI